MFLLNSCLDLFSAPRTCEDPFSLSYGVSLPSSLTVNHPSASVYSTRPRVSVYGTGAVALLLSGFSREHDYQHCRTTHKGFGVLSAFGSGRGLSYVPPHLRPSTSYSVRRRLFHFSVTASRAMAVTEY